MTFSFHYTVGTKFALVDYQTGTTDFYNLKNKAEGARRYGYEGRIELATNPLGEVAYRAEYQTTLSGSRYQSRKASKWVATEAEARELLTKTIAGALKRYAKLATDPRSKIERREG